ncbi:MAG: extracellular solute-binding protein, partial [Eubacteriales bacterium]
MDKRKIGIIVIGVIFLCCVMGAFYKLVLIEELEDQEGMGSAPTDTLRIWYVDENLSDYVASVALSFYEETNVRVIPTLISGLEYLERIYDASITQVDYPDLYIASNDMLEKAYLAGIATEILDAEGLVTTQTYPQSALYAVTYHDKIVGYPLSFETSVFVYNKTYMVDIAGQLINLEDYERRLEEDPYAELMLEAPDESAVLKRAEEIVPSTFSDILMLANVYDAPTHVEAFFEWDVSDVFYNYFFVGNSMNIGGVNGDDITQIEIYNQEAITSLQMYQLMQQFFYIDPEKTTYDALVTKFIEGKLVFMIAGTDIVHSMEAAQRNGSFTYEYEVTILPDINNNIQAQGMSVTNAIVINGLSDKQELANELAAFIAIENSDKLYQMSGEISARTDVVY